MAIYSTIWSSWPGWTERVEVIDWRATGTAGLLRRLAGLGPDDVAIVNGALGWEARWRDMVGAALGRAARRGTRLVVSDASWHPRSGPAESRTPVLWGAAAGLTRALDRWVAGPRTVFCFLSRAEVADFEAAAGRAGGRAVYTPFMTSLPDELVSAGVPPARGRTRRPVVFTGGNTLRDWDLLREALGGLDVRVRVATRHTGGPWPANFDVGPCSHAEFFELAATSSVGVLTLRSDTVRSCGQQTYLNLLRLGTPVVVNDAAGVADHLGGVPGAWVVPSGRPGELRERVGWLLDPAHEAEVVDLAAAGQQLVERRFSPEAYLGSLLAVADDLVARTS